ncbi:MAG: ABC transporter ATP-binding protein [Acidobacteria bacterium]|nr:ABC transporter ATP-binding protein [Acidobacteriota bacterium]MCA1639547.1 ABC transporter ATP-binding protein [Acidobacteriota bacterium]
MLKVQNITIGYGKSEVIKNVSFVLQNGEILAVLGANGAGKTTLLRALNGILPIRKGEISLDGKNIKNYSRREIARKTAVVAQENETKFPVTVLEFILAGRFAHGNAFGWETENDLQIAENALEMCDLKDYASRLMNELSGGERQRVVLARALVTEAKILLLDEPTANLDLAHQAMMFRLVRERCKSCESSAIIITHDLNLASEFADEILLLKRGKVLAKGKPEAVLTSENLQTTFDVKVLLDENPASKKRRVTTIY